MMHRASIAIPRTTLAVVARQRFSSVSPRRPLFLASSVAAESRGASQTRCAVVADARCPTVIVVSRRPIHLTSINLSGVIDVEGPAFAESISEGDIRWIKQKGDQVNEDELVAEIETDKTSVEVNAPQSGTIVELLVADGSKVTAKQKLYRLQPGAGGGAPAATAPAKEEPKAAAPPPPPPKPSPADSPAAPARQSAPTEAPALPKHAGAIPTSKPPVAKPPTAPLSSTPTSQIGITRVRVPEGVSPDQAITGSREEVRVKMNRMRNRIAQRLKDAQNTYAMLTTFNEVDMSNVMEMRTRYQKEFLKKHGIKIGLMSPFVRAAAYGLTEQPVINAVIDEGEIVYRRFVDISIAVSTPKGLVVPVLRNVESLDYAGIELEIAALGEKARDNKLAVEDMEGGTFTISNGGVFGSVFGTPIINPPQAAILGMHGIFDRPVAVNGKVEIRPIMHIALTYDHRLVDGREAVTFLKKIKQAVEDPRIILMNL